MTQTDYYKTWTESELRNSIWHASQGRPVKGPYQDVGLLRAELRLRGLTDEGYHNC